MAKWLLLSVVVIVLFAFAFGGVLFSPPPDPALLAARADTERARAAAAWAKAEEARAAADTERAKSEAWRAALPELAAGLRLLTVGGAVLLLAGLAGIVRAVWRRGAVVPLSGLSALEAGGVTILFDPSRGLGSVTAIGPGGEVRLPLSGSAEAHQQIATSALQAGVLTAAVTAPAAPSAKVVDWRAESARVMATAFEGLRLTPAPDVDTRMGAPADNTGSLRIISRNVAKPAPDVVKRGYMAEYLKHGQTIGFARRAWAGKVFADGEKCSQTLWAKLNQAARKANLLTDDGAKLRVPIGEALAQLGLEEFSEGV